MEAKERCYKVLEEFIDHDWNLGAGSGSQEALILAAYNSESPG